MLNDGLIINKISKSIGKKPIVRDVNLNIQKGEIVGLLGPNGAGKTTTFHMIVGLMKPDSGAIYLDKTNVSNLPIYLRGKRGISYLPQEASIFRGMNVEDNLMSIIEIVETNKNKHQILLENLLLKNLLQKLIIITCIIIYTRLFQNILKKQFCVIRLLGL